MTVNIPFVPAFLPLFDCKKRYIFLFGGRGGAKSWQIGIILLEKGRHEKLRILCTREIQKSIKESVHTLLKDLINQYKFNDYEVLEKTIRNRITGSEFLFVGLREHNIKSIQSYANIDYCFVEESQAVTTKSLNILTPTIRKAGSQIVFCYNRSAELDPIHKLFKQECTNNINKKFTSKEGKEYTWIEYHGPDALGIFINGETGNPYFPEELRKEAEKDKINDYDLYMHKWLGEPESQGGYALIPRKLVMESVERQVQDWNYVAFGVDPAWRGVNKSVLAIRHGFRILPLYSFKGIDNMRLVGEIIIRAKEFYQNGYTKTIQINIDVGYGAGVIDRLNELKELEDIKSAEQIEFDIEVNPVNFGGKEVDPKYFNKTAELWGEMKEALKTMNIPNNPELIHQLTTRRYKLHSDSQIRLISKEEMKEESPDEADAVSLALDTSSYNIDFSNDELSSGRAKNYMDNMREG